MQCASDETGFRADAEGELTPAIQPAVPLLAWQKRYIEDESRFKFLAKCVQSGGSFVSSLEFSLDALLPENKLGILLSASERQSKELIEKVAMHTRGWDVAIDSGYFEETSIAQHTVRFPNGNRIIGLPANPDTARGFSGNVLLDEFALHRDPRKIWAAMIGRATRGYKVRVLSSFQGTENKFYELAKTLGLHDGRPEIEGPVFAKSWSGHFVDIFMCREQGLDINIEEIREALDDEEIFQQEYLCIPMSSAENYFPLDLVLACESGDASVDWDGEARPRLFAGMDIGRKKDRTVIVIGEECDGVVTVRGVIWMERTPFAEQQSRAHEVAKTIEQGGGRFLIDATGLGMQLAETLAAEFSCVEQIPFNAEIKERMAVTGKRRLEARTLLLPEDRRIRRAFQAIRRLAGAQGRILFDAARTALGHADEFWAVMLMLIGSESGGGYVAASEGGLVGKALTAGMMGRVF